MALSLGDFSRWLCRFAVDEKGPANEEGQSHKTAIFIAVFFAARVQNWKWIADAPKKEISVKPSKNMVFWR